VRSCSPRGECCDKHRMVLRYPPGLTCDNCIVLREIKIVHRCSPQEFQFWADFVLVDTISQKLPIERVLFRRAVGRAAGVVQD
jgi:hypothetical protein